MIFVVGMTPIVLAVIDVVQKNVSVRAAERYTRVMLAKERRNANSRTYNTTYNTRYNNKKKKGRY